MTRDRFREARDAIELLVAVLSAGDAQLDRAGFYSRLAEGVGHIARMRRLVVFLFDEATWRYTRFPQSSPTYASALYRKLDVHSRVEAVQRAQRLGLIR